MPTSLCKKLSAASPAAHQKTSRPTTSKQSKDTSMLKRTFIAASALLAATPALAAQNGTLGPTSTGSFDATLTIEAQPQAQVRVSGLTDLAFGTIQAGAPQVINRTTPVCIYATTPQGASLTVSQAGGTGFRMTSGANTVGLSLSLFNNVTGTPPTSVSNGTAIFLPTNTVSETCATGGAFEIQATAVTSSTTSPGNYSGTITLLVAPL